MQGRSRKENKRGPIYSNEPAARFTPDAFTYGHYRVTSARLRRMSECIRISVDTILRVRAYAYTQIDVYEDAPRSSASSSNPDGEMPSRCGILSTLLVFVRAGGRGGGRSDSRTAGPSVPAEETGIVVDDVLERAAQRGSRTDAPEIRRRSFHPPPSVASRLLGFPANALITRTYA